MSNGLNLAIVSGVITNPARLVPSKNGNFVTLGLRSEVVRGQAVQEVFWEVSCSEQYGTPLLQHLQAGINVIVIGSPSVIGYSENGVAMQKNRIYADQITGRDINFAIVIGNVGKDAALAYANGDRAVANWTLAANEYAGRDGNGQRIDRTTWWRPSVWGKRAESLASIIKKGVTVALVGSIVQGKPWMADNGEVRASNEMWADDVIMLSGSRQARNEQGFADTSDPLAGMADELGGSVDDIGF